MPNRPITGSPESPPSRPPPLWLLLISMPVGIRFLHSPHTDMEEQKAKQKKKTKEAAEKEEGGVGKRNAERSSNSRQTIFRGGQLQVAEDDASFLIGSIIEKGISENPQTSPSPLLRLTPPPKPSVLPFPVARHRSHGPHWRPISSTKGGLNDNEDGEDNDPGHFDPISAFANPVQRKQKKVLNLSQWRDLIASDKTEKKEEDRLCFKKTTKHNKGGDSLANVGQQIMELDSSQVNEAPVEVDVQLDLSSSIPQTKTLEAVSNYREARPLNSAADKEADAGYDMFEGEVRSSERISSSGAAKPQIGEVGIVSHLLTDTTLTAVSTSRLNNSANGQKSMSIEREIDAENRARLQSMSPEEIAEARAEIMEKLDPSLLNLLRKHGQEKLNKQKLSSSNGDYNGQVANTLSENQSTKRANISAHSQSDNYEMTTSSTSKDTKSRLNNDVGQNSAPGNGSLWNTWAERVEAVRGLRFSLEGDVIADESKTGHTSIDKRGTADSVAERDFLRTEGDPGFMGYTVKEAMQLTRSVIPGQRALALHLFESVLGKAIHGIQQNHVGGRLKEANRIDECTDWEAVWAFAIGPEPELALALRMCLDDNHSSVVLACARVILCALSCDLNEDFFQFLEKITSCEKGIFTAPVFRSKPVVDVDFLRGGFWKYNAKRSNVLTFGDDVIDEEKEVTSTIQDDVVVAGQDFAAGLVRMGILPRMRYLLDAKPAAALEECIISILITIARHSPTCANAIVNCQGLVHSVVHRFTLEDDTEIRPSKINSVRLLRVLVQSDKKICADFIKDGYFQAMTRHLYQEASPLEQWAKLGKEKCKFFSALVVEQLHFWKVCIHYDFCISYFNGIFPALCLWLNPPDFEKLEENNVLIEFASISGEGYHVLEALARKLPNLYTQECLNYQYLTGDEPDDAGKWAWCYVMPIIEIALKWIALKNDSYVSKLFRWKKGIHSDLVFQDSSVISILWVYSAVMHMLSTLLERLKPEESTSLQYLPGFVPKIGMEIIKTGLFEFWEVSDMDHGEDFAGVGSFIKGLCHLRQQSQYETSLVSVCCLDGLLRVMTSVKYLIYLVRDQTKSDNTSTELNILGDGIMTWSKAELQTMLNVFIKLVISEWQPLQSIEMFGRGGPAPGVALGWGASGGGFWSTSILLIQTDATLLIHVLEIFEMVSSRELQTDEEMMFVVLKINSVLGACLALGPRDRVILEKAFNLLFQVPVLMFLNFCLQRFIQNKRTKPFMWEHKKEDYLRFSKILASHFKTRWLSMKMKMNAIDDNTSSGTRNPKKGSFPLETIHENLDTANIASQSHHCVSLVAEWAHQRLPLPMHWFLSPISTFSDDKHTGFRRSNLPNPMRDANDALEVAKAGLFFLLGLEAMSTFISSDVPSPVWSVDLTWKFHSLSVILLNGMGVLEDKKSRDVYETLQDLYGQQLDDIMFRYYSLSLERRNKSKRELLRFQSEIHESYSTFVETLVEQFAAISYGDLLFGRQVSVYLHRSTEATVRLAAWNALSNARVLEILPPLEKFFSEPEGYLEPVEENESILEAYVKSWVSGSLDRAATRGVMAFSLALHHLSSFIFCTHANDKKSLRNKLARFLLRDYSQKPGHEGMTLDFIGYSKPHSSLLPEERQSCLLQSSDIIKRFEVLTEACEGNSSLLTEVEKLKAAFEKKHLLN